MIFLKPINDSNFQSVIQMKVQESQKDFVASNIYSLAQAWLHQDIAKPYAIYEDGTPVGFLMLDYDECERTVGLWRFMIDSEHQRKGFGKAAMIELLKMVKEEKKFDLLYLSYVPENTSAKTLYESIGFIETGDIVDDEIMMVFPLTENPKVGATIADEDDLEELLDVIEIASKKGMQIPDCFQNKEYIQTMLENETIRRYTIMGKAIAMSYENILLCPDDKHLNVIRMLMK